MRTKVLPRPPVIAAITLSALVTYVASAVEAPMARAYTACVYLNHEDIGPVHAMSMSSVTWGDTAGRAWANIYDGIKAEAWVRVVDPLGVGSGGDAKVLVPFVVTSTAHTPGDAVTVDLDVTLDGAVHVAIGGMGDAAATARSSLLASVLSADQSVTYASCEGEFEATALADGSFETDIWGDFKGAVSGDAGAYGVDFADVLSFTAYVNETYVLEMDLGTGAGYYPNGGAATTVTAEADFYDSGSYALHSPDAGVSFVILPEPRGVVLFVAGLGLMLALRRRL